MNPAEVNIRVIDGREFHLTKCVRKHGEVKSYHYIAPDGTKAILSPRSVTKPTKLPLKGFVYYYPYVKQIYALVMFFIQR